MIELVDEKRQEELWQAYVERCTELRELREKDDFVRLAGARTDYTEGILDVLEESGVVDEYGVDLPGKCPFKDERWCEILESMCGFECKCESACPLRKGAVLVRAKP